MLNPLPRSFYHMDSEKYSCIFRHLEILRSLIFFTGLIFLGCTVSNSGKTPVIIYSEENNDLYRLLVDLDIKCNHFDNVTDALNACNEYSTLLILARNYPSGKTILPPDFYEILDQKKIRRTYVEFPDHIHSETTGEILPTRKERLIFIDSTAPESSRSMQILDAGLFSYVQVKDRESWLKGANVAGFRQAIYGLDSTANFPVLFEDRNVLVSTTKLSNFNKSRYSPKSAIREILRDILQYLEIDIDTASLSWSPSVSPMYKKDEILPADAYQTAIEKGASWYLDGRFLIHPDWQSHWQTYDTLALPVGPPVDTTFPSGDGSLGVMEGHYSYINPDGSQPYRYWLRADCVAETAMTLASVSQVNHSPGNDSIAQHLMDFLFNSSAFKTEDNQNKRSNAYGLIGWADTHPYVYYGDDNARVLIGTILTSSMLESDQWNQEILRLILANFRTTGINGFRGNSLREPAIENISLDKLMERDLINPAPHYESWLWAIYFWLYDKTGYIPLLEKAKRAIYLTMEKYPADWIWTNGIQQERARMILPLAWLVRVEDTPEHRQWLLGICHDLLERQVACGALREELGEGNKGKYGAPASNKAYGHNEAPVIHENGDPMADMLYTSNFAFFALNEAAGVVQDSVVNEAVRKLSDFLVRIQSHSTLRPDLNGCWFRAFDYDAWEYYGSNADHGWGAWGTLTGWTQSFITTTLALRKSATTFWDLTQQSSVGANIGKEWSEMLPQYPH